MLNVIRAVVDRLTAMLVTAAAQEAEAVVLARSAERQAELARQAQKLDHEGQSLAASQLRHQVTGVDATRPLLGVLPALDHWLQPDKQASQLPALPEPTPASPAKTPSRRRSRR